MNLSTAIEKIDKIKERIESAFEKGEIDFDVIASDLDSLKDDLESKMSRDNNTVSDFVPRRPLKINDFR